jgi:predicted outer membrane repeat protein
MRRSIVFACATCLFAASGVMAESWYVKADGTGDVPTIQAAVDTVAPGDTVLLASGTYTGIGNYNVVVPNKAFLIVSETGDPEDCIIDCEGHLGSDRRGFYFQTSWTTPPVVRGITIRNGHRTHYGGAVLCEGSLTMRDCVFESNVTDDTYFGGGGAVAYSVASGEPALKNCTFISNRAASWGGAISIDGIDLWVRIDSCTFYENQADGVGGAIYCWQHEAEALIGHSLFIRNSAASAGGAVYVDNMAAVIGNCTFYANHAPTGSAVYTNADYYLGYPFAAVQKCIIANGTGGAAYFQPYYPTNEHALYCTNIWGNEGGDYADSLATKLGVDGNFSARPEFCNYELEPYDLSLCDISPCLPGNHPDGYACGLVGALGEGCICDPTRTEPSTWGAIKAMYR